ncbi:MAG: cobalamin-dependent protein [Deltaproteobacteria bacterium]|nr:cobalamin-dependent protein [Deltaproteobacteria bacterium]
MLVQNSKKRKANCKVMLIHPSNSAFVEQEGDRPPLGILYLASVIEKIPGIEIQLLDLTIEAKVDIRYFLSTFKPQIVGITITTPLFPEASRLASFIKELLPKTFVVAGGPHPSSLPEETLLSKGFDIVVRGEGEGTFKELVECLKEGEDFRSIPGIAYIDKNEFIQTADRPLIEDLDTIPFPARHLLPIHSYHMTILGIPATPIITSRGCPYHCIFCTKAVFGHQYRTRRPEKIVEEIEMILDAYGIRGFLFVDDTFTLDSHRTHRFCDSIIEKKMDIIWRCWTRSDCVDLYMLEKMYQAGCRIICFGVESGDQDVLDTARKGTTVKRNLEAIQMAQSVGLTVKAFFMVGLPGENETSIEKTLNFVDRAQPDMADFYVAIPFPKTFLSDHVEEFGIRVLTQDWSKYYQIGLEGKAPEIVQTSALNHQEVIQAQQKLQSCFQQLKKKKFTAKAAIF